MRVIFRLGIIPWYPGTGDGRIFCVSCDTDLAQFFVVPEPYIVGSVSLGSIRMPALFTVGEVYSFSKLLPVNSAESSIENL